jgi:hypothetical protein
VRDSKSGAGSHWSAGCWDRESGYVRVGVPGVLEVVARDDVVDADVGAVAEIDSDAAVNAGWGVDWDEDAGRADGSVMRNEDEQVIETKEALGSG